MPDISGSVVFAINGTKHAINVNGDDVSLSTTLYDYLRQRTSCTVCGPDGQCCSPTGCFRREAVTEKRVMNHDSINVADKKCFHWPRAQSWGAGREAVEPALWRCTLKTQSQVVQHHHCIGCQLLHDIHRRSNHFP